MYVEHGVRGKQGVYTHIKTLELIILFRLLLNVFLANTIYTIADNNTNVSYKHSTRIFDKISAKYVYLPLNFETVILDIRVGNNV